MIMFHLAIKCGTLNVFPPDALLFLLFLSSSLDFFFLSFALHPLTSDEFVRFGMISNILCGISNYTLPHVQTLTNQMFYLSVPIEKEINI